MGFEAAAGDAFRPVEDAWGAQAALKEGAFVAAKAAVAFGAVAAVIGGVDDEGVVQLAERFELGDEAGNGAVRVVDGGRVNGGGIVEFAIL